MKDFCELRKKNDGKIIRRTEKSGKLFYNFRRSSGIIFLSNLQKVLKSEKGCPCNFVLYCVVIIIISCCGPEYGRVYFLDVFINIYYLRGSSSSIRRFVICQ